MDKQRNEVGYKTPVSSEISENWIAVLECMVWLLVILIVSVGFLLALQLENLFVSLFSLFALLAVGLAIIAALKVFVGMARDLKKVKRMLHENQDMTTTPVRHRRSNGQNANRKKDLYFL